MAGTILVSEGKGISLSSVDFDVLVEKIRPCFREEEGAIRDIIYEPVDEGGLAYISLKEQNTEGFNAFVRAAQSAYRIVSEQFDAAQRSAMWDELLHALEADPRFQGR